MGIARNGHLLVADSHYHCVREYTAAGELVRTFGGKPGWEPGEWGYVSDIVQDDDGTLFVSEFGKSDRITKLDADGQFLKCWGQNGQAPGEFNRVRALALGPDGLLYAADACNHRVQVFTSDGDFVRQFGTAGSGPGELSYPYDLALSPDGKLYVVERGNHRVQKFTPEGQSLGTWGSPGRGPGQLADPWALVIDKRGKVSVIDTENHRVSGSSSDESRRWGSLSDPTGGTITPCKQSSTTSGPTDSPSRYSSSPGWRSRSAAAPGLPALAFAAGSLGVGGLLLGGPPVTVDETPVSLAVAAMAVAATAIAVALLVALVFRAWSYRLGLVLGVLLLMGVGGFTLRPAAAGVGETVGSIRGLQFVRPLWLLLLGFVPAIVLVSRRSLSGLGPTRKWAAITLRCLGVALLAAALAEPRLRRPTDNATVLFVVDRSFSIPQDLDLTNPETAAVDRRWERVKGFIETAVARRPGERREDQVGLILFGKRPRLALPPAQVDRLPIDERQAGPINGEYTDISAAIKLALASFPQGTGKRMVLISDGNENVGTADEQARIARDNGVQIDTIALAPGYRNESEILVQAVESPRVAAQGQRLPIRVLIRNSSPNKVVDGRLDVTKASTGENSTVEIEDGPQLLEMGKPPKVRLLPGLNVFRFRDRVDPQGDSSFTYRATFTPTESRPMQGGVASTGLPGDRVENNRVETAVVSRGQRRVLLQVERRAFARLYRTAVCRWPRNACSTSDRSTRGSTR